MSIRVYAENSPLRFEVDTPAEAAELLVEMGKRAVVPGSPMTAPKNGNGHPGRKQLKRVGRSKGSSEADVDAVRVRVARHIVREGPSSTSDLRELFNLSRYQLERLLDHPWFEKQGSTNACKVHVTTLGHQSASGKDAED